MRRTHLVTILVLLALALPASPAHAGGVVDVCDEAHLLAALAGGGMVTFTCSGTITLTATITIAADTTIDGSGQDVTISGNDAVRVFTVNSGDVLNLNRLTIANGRASYGGGIYNSGGGIYNSGGTVTVSSSTFSGNRAGNGGVGGGIYNSGGTVTVSSSTFSGNSAPHVAGGIGNEGALIIRNSTFSSNISGNYGGGIVNNGTLTVNNSTFHANTTGEIGGGILNDGGGEAEVSNSTFVGNNAHLQGGGIYDSGTLNVSNTTFSGNNASSGGGIYKDSSYGTVLLKNTIVANSAAGGNCSGPITDGGGNLSHPDATCPGINADPVLGPSQNNGGPTWTMALSPGSAAIDAGIDAICAAPPVNSLDQRGIARPQGAHCDIGAVERYCPSFVPPGTVGVEDIVAIATRWGWTDATPGWDPVYDLNGDNRIDVVDILLVTRVWGGTCS